MFPWEFWQRYRDEYECVTVLGRVRNVAEVVPGWKRVDGIGVQCCALPDYRGPLGFMLRRWELKRKLRRGIGADCAVILRVPSPIADLAQSVLGRSGRPYGVEVVGDPWDVFAPGAVRHPFRALFRRLFARRLRRQCRDAAAAAYVTREALQRRYPAGSNAFATHYSSIRLLDEDYLDDTARRPNSCATPAVLVSVGTMAQMYKGFDTLIRAVHCCRALGSHLRLHLVGDGACRSQLEGLVEELGLTASIEFHGQLPAGNSIRAVLDGADLFVLASRQEGLPRAMIEAMARGLPCIGTSVGGIPELLPHEVLVPPDDPPALADMIRKLLGDSALRGRLGRENLKVARDYHEDVLRLRRRALYGALRAATEEWRGGRRSA